LLTTLYNYYTRKKIIFKQLFYKLHSQRKFHKAEAFPGLSIQNAIRKRTMVITPQPINPSASPLNTQEIVATKNTKHKQAKNTSPPVPSLELAKQELSAMKANIASKVSFLFILLPPFHCS
jgi:hypothetical protein